MKTHFYKYQATGNDFVVFDNRDGRVNLSIEQIAGLCDRKLGVGADGVMLIERDASTDFKLVYYNSDGSQSLCGNGSRAAVHLAEKLGMAKPRTTFTAYDGIHEAELLAHDIVKLKMNDVQGVKQLGEDLFLNTGSPHYIRFQENVESFPVFDEGRKIRYREDFSPGGTNVNFVEPKTNNRIFVRTYERGVENETLSCGTGVTAAAIAASLRGYNSPVRISTLGGDLTVEFKNGHSNSNATPAAPGSVNGHSGTFTDIFLIGPAKLVFEGDVEL